MYGSVVVHPDDTFFDNAEVAGLYKQLFKRNAKTSPGGPPKFRLLSRPRRRKRVPARPTVLPSLPATGILRFGYKAGEAGKLPRERIERFGLVDHLTDVFGVFVGQGGDLAGGADDVRQQARGVGSMAADALAVALCHAHSRGLQATRHAAAAERPT